MAISGFEFPRVTLSQSYAAASAATSTQLNVACIGPKYILHRPDVAAEAALVPQTDQAYSADSGLTLDSLPGYKGGIVDVVNTETQHLKVDNGVFAYFDEDNATFTTSAGTYDFVEKTGTVYKWEKEGTSDSFMYTESKYPAVGDNAYTDTALSQGSAAITAVGHPDFTVTDSTVTFPNYYIKPGNGYDAAVAFGSRGVQVGDPIIIHTSTGDTYAQVLAVETTVSGGGFNKLVVSANYIDALADAVALTFCEYATAIYDQSATTFEITTSIDGSGATVYGLDIKAGLTFKLADLDDVAGRFQSGAMYIEYRERSIDGAGTYGTITSASDVENVLGGICADNPLALACYFALRSGTGSTVYYSIVTAESVAGYVAAVELLSKFNTVYSIVPCTSDAAIIQACMSIVENESNSEDSKIRRSLWYGVDTPDELPLWTGTGTFSTSGSDTLVTLSDDVFIAHPLQTGDVLQRVYAPYTTYKIARTNGVNVATLEAGTTDTGSNVPLRLVRTAPTSGELASQVIALRSDRTRSERAVCVWADDAIYNGEHIGNYALAAAAAGMRAYEPCQRPLSNLGYNFFQILDTHNFTRANLIDIGSNGIWIIDNNQDGTPINMKQVTTAVASNLLLDEESIIANADTLALNLVHLGENYVGCSNITPMLISLIRSMLNDYLSSCCINTTGSVFIGPQLLSYTIIDVWQDPVNLDKIYASIDVQPPRPFNRLHITMRVI